MAVSERRSTPELDLYLNGLPSERAFVMRWFVKTGELGFKIRDFNRPETKTGILSSICSLSIFLTSQNPQLLLLVL